MDFGLPVGLISRTSDDEIIILFIERSQKNSCQEIFNLGDKNIAHQYIKFTGGWCFYISSLYLLRDQRKYIIAILFRLGFLVKYANQEGGFIVSSVHKFGTMERGFDIGRAVAEADRCLLCHDAPCSRGCPAGTDPGTFIRKLRLRNITGAIRTIKENNILGGACGVLCPTARLCEQECCATGIDRPVEIGKIQRFLVEHAWERNFTVFEKAASRSETIAVVGSGPAGLSCAAELAKSGFQVTLFEARAEPGGVLRYGVPAHRFDKAFLDTELGEIESLGVVFRCNAPIYGNKGAEKLLEEGFDAVFLGPGLWGATRLKTVPEETEGLLTSVDFLAGMRNGKGDIFEKQFSGKAVAVIGGGSVAMDCAQSAARLGAGDVYLVYRRSWSQMPAEADEKIETLDDGVHYLLLNQPVDYVVADKNIKGIKLVRTRLGEPDVSGRRTPVNIEGSEWILEADVVIEAIGNRAPQESPGWYPSVAVDENRLIKVNDNTCETSVKGIFAGGDIVQGPALVVTAVRDGKAAAKAIEKYLIK